jgi:hypothetical protein
MPTKTNESDSEEVGSNAERRPPRLSEKLIAQLQGAVTAAQQKRMKESGATAPTTSRRRPR